jgi:Methyltransferase domain
MFPFWKTVIEPAIRASGARRVVEVGALRGENTELMLDALPADAELHVIDPVPIFDPEEHRARFGSRYVFHQALSLEVLGSLGAFDAALIDGDHNWYTVYNELTTIARIAAAEGKPFPLTLMHDVDFPYADRDMYYFPRTIPEEFRQPTGRGGMVMGLKELVDDGGLNAGSHNALNAGGPRNGVKTAINDFLAEVDAPVSFTSVIGFFGLGILYDERQVGARPALAERLAELDSPEWLREQCRRIEHGRLLALTQLQDFSRRESAARRAARQADPA